MKRSILFLSLFFCVAVNAQNVNVDALRKEYFKLNTDSVACARIYRILLNTDVKDNLLNGYKGAVSMIKAKYLKSKEEKIKLFTAGKKVLEQSIKTDSVNAELRFLRFTIQTNCPKALGYYKQIDPDKEFIISHFTALKNSELKQQIAEYLLSSSCVTADEKKKIKSAGY